MKLTAMIFSFLFLLGFTFISHAEQSQNKPCKEIKAACEAAGFKRNGGKGTLRNCMGPLMMGKEVPGVAVDAATIEACKVKRAHMMQMRKQQQRKNGAMQETPPPSQ